MKNRDRSKVRETVGIALYYLLRPIGLLNTGRRRFIAGALAVCMLLSMLPVAGITTRAATGSAIASGNFATTADKWEGNQTVNLIPGVTLPVTDAQGKLSTDSGADVERWQAHWNTVMVPAGWGSDHITGYDNALQVVAAKALDESSTFLIRPTTTGTTGDNANLGGAGGDVDDNLGGVSYTVELSQEDIQRADTGILQAYAYGEFYYQKNASYHHTLSVEFLDAQGQQISVERHEQTGDTGDTESSYLAYTTQNYQVPGGTKFVRFWYCNVGSGDARKAVKNMQAYLADTMTHTGHQGWTEWSAAGGTLSGGKYYLAQSNDTALATTVYIKANATVYLCLNGNTLSTDSRIYVYDKGTLHICDCSAGHTGKITSSGSYTVENHGTLYLHSGTLENTESSGYTIYSSDNSTVSVSGGGAAGRNGIYAIGTSKVYLSGSPDLSGSYRDIYMGADTKLYATASADPSSAAYTGDVLTLGSGKIAFDPVVYNAGSTEKFLISGSYPLYLAENGRDLTWDKDYTPDSEMQMAYKKWDSTTYDVIGNSSSGWLLTTFNEEGYRTIAEGLTGATVVCTPKFVNGGKYVQLRYTVTAGGQDITAGKLAVHADVKIGSNDRAAIEVIKDGETVVGLKMADNAAGQFSLYFRGPGTGNADTYWFGYYNNKRDNYFNQLSEDTKSKSGSYTSDFSAYSNADSGMALSWQNIELAAGQSKTFSILVGVGDAVDAPVLTSFTPATAAEQVNYTATVTDKEGTPIELYYSIDGGDELSLGTQTVENGQTVFTGTVDCALLSAGSHEVTFWAINDAGAMSGSKTCTVSVTDKHIHSDFEGYFREWTASDGLPTQSGSYYLAKDVRAFGIITIPENVTVNLCLNGKTVNINGYHIVNNGTLNICDCQNNGKITGNQNQSIYNKGTLNICGGTVENNHSGSASYSIYNTNTGTAAVSGGTVSGTFCGIKNEGTLYISGGAVTADADYAILNDETDADVHVSGGSISAERYGIRNLAGTVYLSGQPTVTGATASIYKVAMDARLYAHSNDTTPVPYTGDLLTLYIPSANSGNVAVYGVTSENMDSFRITNDGFSLVLVEDDLVLHQHSWSYSLSPDGKTITAQCRASNCDYAGTDKSITIAAPEKTVYNDGKNANATLSGGSIVGQTALPAIKYVGRGGTVYQESTTAPTNAGKYTAKITIGGVTASVDYEIAKATPTDFSWPTGLKGVAGNPLSSVALPQGFTWSDPSRILDYERRDYVIRYQPADQNYAPVMESISVEVDDETPPTGTISIGGKTWSSFIRKEDITFDVFFPEKQTVTITLEDERYGSGVDYEELCYYISTEQKSLNELGDMAMSAWTEYTGPFDITPNRKCIIYVRFQDLANNMTYLSSDGIVLDSVAPVISGITDGAAYCGDVEVTVRDDFFEKVTVDGREASVTDGKFTLSHAIGQHMIQVYDKAGNVTTCTITFDNNHAYTYDASTADTIVEKCRSCDFAASAQIKKPTGELVYNESAHNATVVYTGTLSCGNDLSVSYGTAASTVNAGDYTASITLGGKTASVSYKVEKATVAKPQGDSTVFTYTGSEQTYAIAESGLYTVAGNCRTNAGSQDVTVTLKDKANYQWADGTTGELKFTFRIGTASFTAEVQQSGTLVYNGSQQTAQVVTTPSGVQGGMTVTYKYGLAPDACTDTAVPAFKNADSYTVYFVAEADNHKDASGSFTVKIEPKEIGIAWQAPANLVFDGSAKLPHAVATGLCQSDTLQLDVALTAENDNVNAGSFTYYVTAIDDSNYKLPSGVTSPAYTISARPLEAGDFAPIAGSFVYNGQPHTPVPGSLCDLVTADDFTVAYQNNTNAGTDTAKITVTGKNNATGTVDIYFTIAKATPPTEFPTGLNIGTDKLLSHIQLPAGYTWDAPDTEVAYGPHDYPVTFTPEDLANYNPVKQNVAVYGNDITAPTGTLEIGMHTWNSFWNNVTFGLFFKETQSVTVTAADTESGVARTEYYLAAGETADFTDAVWEDFEDTFAIDPNNAYVVYIRITDHAGNAAILNSSGVVLDNILPALSGIENGRTYYQSAEVTVTDANLDRVEVNGREVTVTDGSFTLTSDAAPQTVQAFDKAGNISAAFTVTVEAEHRFTWGQWYDNRDGSHSKDGHCICGADLTVTAPKEDEAVVDGLEEVSEAKGKDLKLIVETELAKIDAATVASIQKLLAAGISAEYLDISVWDVVGNVDISDTARVLEIPVAFAFDGKLNITVYRSHEGTVNTLKALDARPSGDFTDGSYFLDLENEMIYIYSRLFSTYGVAYHSHSLVHYPEKAPTKESDGHIEHWRCEGCEEYFTDAQGEEKIAQPDTVLKYSESPDTGDSRSLGLWLGLLLVSCAGLVTVVCKKRKGQIL